MTETSTVVESQLDPDQALAKAALDRIAGQLLTSESWWRRRRSVRGLYLWGSPGRGKTMLVDRFADRLSGAAHRRWHFHEFFDLLQEKVSVHARRPAALDHALDDLLTTPGDALRVLVFDEFHIHDPGSATLLIRLLREIGDRRITLVATANVPPEGLLPDPVFHPAFAPGVVALTDLTRTLELVGDRDYRLGGAGVDGGFVSRPMSGARSFADVCGRPVSARDYLDAASSAGPAGTGWHICEIPLLDLCPVDHSVRFVHLVDVAVDRGIPLWLSTHQPVADLLASSARVRDGQRLRSRLGALPLVDPASGSQM